MAAKVRSRGHAETDSVLAEAISLQRYEPNRFRPGPLLHVGKGDVAHSPAAGALKGPCAADSPGAPAIT